MAHQPTCPICQKPVAPRAENKGFPFCSLRCRQVDLGKWLGEEYRVPERQSEEREDESGPGGGGPDERAGGAAQTGQGSPRHHA